MEDSDQYRGWEGGVEQIVSGQDAKIISRTVEHGLRLRNLGTA